MQAGTTQTRRKPCRSETRFVTLKQGEDNCQQGGPDGAPDGAATVQVAFVCLFSAASSY